MTDVYDHFKEGIKFSAIGTNRILYVYTGGIYYDIHPIKTDFGALTNKLASTDGSPILTITLSSTSGMTAGDILFLESVTPPTGSGYSASDFDDKTFMITEVVDATSVTITSSWGKVLFVNSHTNFLNVLIFDIIATD